MPSTTKPFVGAAVHYILDSGPHALECRPAWIVVVQGENARLRVATLGIEDGATYAGEHGCGFYLTGTMPYGNGAHVGGTWHWTHEGCGPERLTAPR